MLELVESDDPGGHSLSAATNMLIAGPLAPRHVGGAVVLVRVVRLVMRPAAGLRPRSVTDAPARAALDYFRFFFRLLSVCSCSVFSVFSVVTLFFSVFVGFV